MHGDHFQKCVFGNAFGLPECDTGCCEPTASAPSITCFFNDAHGHRIPLVVAEHRSVVTCHRTSCAMCVKDKCSGPCDGRTFVCDMAGSGSNVRDTSPFWMDAAAARVDVFAEAYAKSAAAGSTSSGSAPFSLWPGAVSPPVVEGIWRSYQPAKTTEEASRDFRFGQQAGFLCARATCSLFAWTALRGEWSF